MVKDKTINTVKKFNIYEILSYFIIYSILGYVIEIIYALVTKGVLESRQGLVYGPFSPIYGLGATVMILCLQYFRKNNYTIFLGGFIIGSIIEYLISLFGEIFLHVKWWDYSYMPLNINGRVCVFFSLFWGLLSLYLILHFNPFVDNITDKIKSKFKSSKRFNTLIIIASILFLLDYCLTLFSLKMFSLRLVDNFNLNLQDVNSTSVSSSILYQNDFLRNTANIIFSDKKMLKTFPNLKLTDINGNTIYVASLFPDIQPYYLSIFTPKIKLDKIIDNILS